jgi:hypothetical protein
MSTCFVIQPFDGAKFDKRFSDVYKPAIEQAGLEAYRVDTDPGVLIPIESIEKGIRQATVCLADISTDNPNVWYELGFAFASKRPVVMVCSEDRVGKKYPFDIQHRSIIPYQADSPSDFEKLKSNLTAKLKAMLQQENVLDEIANATPVSQLHGLSQPEILILAVIAGEAYMPHLSTPVSSVRRSAERAGITGMGFNVSVRRLLQKQLISETELWDENSNEAYSGMTINEGGWAWIDQNEKQFVLFRPENPDEVPF